MMKIREIFYGVMSSMETNTDLTAFYKISLEKVTTGIHAINNQGQTIIYNDQMKKIEGLHFDELEDHSILDLFQFSDSEQSTLLQVLDTEQPVTNIKQTYWNQNGQEITTINDTYPVFEGRKIVGAIEFSRDITTLERLMHQPLQRYGEPITFDVITARSKEMVRVIETAKKAAIAKLPTLLIGEAGTGKDLVAEGIHYAMTPAPKQFNTIYCSSSDDRLIERLTQQFKTLSLSTFFFERIEYLSLEQQEQLVLLLEQYASTHVFIASIGNDPINLIAANLLSKELYYYFSAMSIMIPPLRERYDDIHPFIEDFLKRHYKKYRQPIKGISKEVEQLFLQYDWPGNLKELETLLEETVPLLSFEERITYEKLPQHFKLKFQEYRNTLSIEATDFIIQANTEPMPLEQYLHKAESYYLNKVLSNYQNNITKAAEALGMSRQNLQYRLKKIKKK